MRRLKLGGRLGIMTVVVSALAVIATGVALGSHRFADVPDDHTFHGDITWMAENRITFGCNPPANDRYCPSGNTTRGQMAAFMRRLAENQVVDAGALQGLPASAFLGSNATASDSNQLGGVDADEYVTRDEAGEVIWGSVTLREETESWPIGVLTTTAAECLATEVPISGGYSSTGLALTLNVTENAPTETGWQVSGTATLLSDVTAYVLCAEVG